MSCADVCVSHDDAERGTFSKTRVVTARNRYTCCECRESIAAGTQYERCTGLWDGVFDTFRTCLPCREIRMAFVCGGFIFEMLWESIETELFPVWSAKGAWDCLAKLTTDSAIEKCNARFREWCDVREL